MPSENPHFSNGPMQPFLLQPQPPIGRPHTDFSGPEMKEVQWDGSRPMNDIQDKSQQVYSL